MYGTGRVHPAPGGLRLSPMRSLASRFPQCDAPYCCMPGSSSLGPSPSPAIKVMPLGCAHSPHIIGDCCKHSICIPRILWYHDLIATVFMVGSQCDTQQARRDYSKPGGDYIVCCVCMPLGASTCAKSSLVRNKPAMLELDMLHRSQLRRGTKLC